MATVVAQPQTSRAGLITTIVISLMINVILGIVYFQKYGDFNKQAEDFKAYQKKYADVVAEAAMTNNDDYKAAQGRAKEVKSSVFDLVDNDRNELAIAVSGTAAASPDVKNNADAERGLSNNDLTGLAKDVGLSVSPGNNLIETLKRWPALVKEAIAQREQLKNDLKASEEKAKAADAANTQALAEKDKAIADAKAETAKAMDQITQLQQAQSKSLNDVQAGAAQQLSAVQATVVQKDQSIANLTQANADTVKQVVKLKSALRRFKANPATKENPIRVPDGEIKTVAGDQCFINLGQGDQISVGMTFEVYDPNKGIPPLGDGTSNPEPVRRGGAGSAAVLAGVVSKSSVGGDTYQFDLPKGKGSIEVVSVGPDHTSECRIVHREPGQNISQGDIIANLVYDKNIKFNFFVFGDFDMSNSNINVRTNDAPVIRRLIEQWGGTVQAIADKDHPADSVTPETDFVIVGKEPVIPSYTAEEQNDPGTALILEKAKAKQEAYRAVLAKAADFGVPVMNQNRFLYYTGYFDQAKR